MRTPLIVTSMLFAAASRAQILLDPTLVDKVVNGANDFVSSVLKNPLVITAVSSLESLGVPAASIASAEADPVFLLENLVADYTDVPLINAIPTALGNTLRSVLAVPLKAIEDVAAYISYLETQPAFQTALSELRTYVPTEIQQEFSESPIPFLKNLVEQNTVPTYFNAVPTTIVQGVAEVLNHGLSIVQSDFESPNITTVPTIPSTGTIPYPTGAPKSVVTGVVSATGSVPYGYNQTHSSTGLRSPITRPGSLTGVASSTGFRSYQSSKAFSSSGTGVHVIGTGSHTTGTGSHTIGTGSHSIGTGSHTTGTGSHTTGTGSHTTGTSGHATGSGGANGTASPTGSLSRGYYPTLFPAGAESHHAFKFKPGTFFKGRSLGHQRVRHLYRFP